MKLSSAQTTPSINKLNSHGDIMHHCLNHTPILKDTCIFASIITILFLQTFFKASATHRPCVKSVLLFLHLELRSAPRYPKLSNSSTHSPFNCLFQCPIFSRFRHFHNCAFIQHLPSAFSFHAPFTFHFFHHPLHALLTMSNQYGIILEQ